MKITKLFLICFLALLSGVVLPLSATSYYISPAGNNANNGTSADTPFLTLAKAISMVMKGDVIYVASGTYQPELSMSIQRDSFAIIGVFTSEADRPVFDCSLMRGSYALRFFRCNKGYLYGIKIKNSLDNGLLIEGGSYNKIEFCDFFENKDSGVQLKTGTNHNQIINCDSYLNVDASQGDADGFANKLDAGGFNSFRGCRAWQNSDDGWDGLLNTNTYTPNDTIYDCWTYKNGYLKSGARSKGNGNGFKLGGTQAGASGPFIHRQTVVRCLAALNGSKGFDYNNNAGSMTILNCTGFGNGGTGNFAFPQPVASGETITLKNCLSYNAAYGSLHASAVQVTNNWNIPVTPSAADFESTDPAEMLRPRQNDGSLPDIAFMRLKGGSNLIDAGTDLGMPFSGAKPDLGCFEFPFALGLHDKSLSATSALLYPNPASGILHIKSEKAVNTLIKIYSSFGILVLEQLFTGYMEDRLINIENLLPGAYVVQLNLDGRISSQNMIVVNK